VTDATVQNRDATAAPQAGSVPAIGAPRGGNFWQRWKEWERENGSFPQLPLQDRAA
jgi:hypothetical protein